AHRVAAQALFDVTAREARMPNWQAVEVAHLGPDLVDRRVDHSAYEYFGHLGLRCLKLHALEAARLLGQRDLGGQSLHAAGPVEAMTAAGAFQDVLSIIWRCDRSTVAQDDYIPAHLQCCSGDFVDQPDTRVECLGGGCADASADRDTHVR